MKTTRLLAVLIGLAAISLFAADASAMYHPTMGRFLQRDPGPDASGPARVGTAGPASGSQFAQRDPKGSYHDGMNSYCYTWSNPTNRLDAMGNTWSDFFAKLAGQPVKKAFGVNVQALVQAKIWGPPGLEAGLGGALIFFADTCEIGAFSVAAGLGKDLRDWKKPTAGSVGKSYEGGAQAGVSGSAEAATMSGPSPASAASFVGDFHTLQGNANIPIPTVPPIILPLSASLYFGDADRAGRRWWGGTLGLSRGAPYGIGTLDWNYRLHKTISLTSLPLVLLCQLRN